MLWLTAIAKSARAAALALLHGVELVIRVVVRLRVGRAASARRHGEENRRP